MKNSLKSLFLISALALSTSTFAETKADVVDDAEKNLSRMERVVAAVQGAFEALSSSEEDSEDNFLEKAAKKAKAKFLEVTKIEITEDTKEAAALAKVSLKNAKEYSTELRKVLTQMVLKKSDDVAVQTANKAKVNELVKKIKEEWSTAVGLLDDIVIPMVPEKLRKSVLKALNVAKVALETLIDKFDPEADLDDDELDDILDDDLDDLDDDDEEEDLDQDDAAEL